MTNIYRETSNKSRALVGNKIVDHSDVAGSSPCANHIFIVDLTHGVNGLGKDNYTTRRETYMFWGLVQIILEVWR